MSEARRSERIRAFLGAKIIFNNRMSIIDCVVRNISATGAKLALAGSLPVPGEFELQIPQKGCSYRARLVWRNNEGAGVEFITADVQKSTEARLREIEIENAQLKERVLGLSQRLAGIEQEQNAPAPQPQKIAAGAGARPRLTVV
jgi:hypothetical protein